MLTLNFVPPMLAALIFFSAIQFVGLFSYQSAQVIPAVEGSLFPTATNREFLDIREEHGGISFQVRYYKQAGCKIHGTQWYMGQVLMLPKMEWKTAIPPLAVHESGWQDAGRWFLPVDSLENVTAIMISWCGDKRLRNSPFYPSDIKE